MKAFAITGISLTLLAFAQVPAKADVEPDVEALIAALPTKQHGAKIEALKIGSGVAADTWALTVRSPFEQPTSALCVQYADDYFFSVHRETRDIQFSDHERAQLIALNRSTGCAGVAESDLIVVDAQMEPSAVPVALDRVSKVQACGRESGKKGCGALVPKSPSTELSALFLVVDPYKPRSISVGPEGRIEIAYSVKSNSGVYDSVTCVLGTTDKTQVELSGGSID